MTQQHKPIVSIRQALSVVLIPLLSCSLVCDGLLAFSLGPPQPYPPSAGPPQSVATGDFNADTWIDIAVAEDSGEEEEGEGDHNAGKKGQLDREHEALGGRQRLHQHQLSLGIDQIDQGSTGAELE